MDPITLGITVVCVVVGGAFLWSAASKPPASRMNLEREAKLRPRGLRGRSGATATDDTSASPLDTGIAGYVLGASSPDADPVTGHGGTFGGGGASGSWDDDSPASSSDSSDGGSD